MKNKLKAEYVEWHELKIGDFVENNQYYMFCFSNGSEGRGPSCCGVSKKDGTRYSLHISSAVYKLIKKPTKKLIKQIKTILEYNIEEKYITNLDYIESLSHLKEYEAKNKTRKESSSN